MLIWLSLSLYIHIHIHLKCVSCLTVKVVYKYPITCNISLHFAILSVCRIAALWTDGYLNIHSVEPHVAQINGLHSDPHSIVCLDEHSIMSSFADSARDWPTQICLCMQISLAEPGCKRSVKISSWVWLQIIKQLYIRHVKKEVLQTSIHPWNIPDHTLLFLSFKK